MQLFLPKFSRENVPLENTLMFSWMSRRIGFLADFQLPHAVDEL